MSESRRMSIVSTLKNSLVPITGAELADRFEVSRQVIVQDIAIIRASGIQVIATSSGYMMVKSDPSSESRIIKTFVSSHHGLDRMREELSVVIEYGGKIIDVIVEHPVYGEIVGTLHLGTQEEVNHFVRKWETSTAKPLSVLTEGEHIHTIEVPSEKIYDLILNELRVKGFVVSE